MSSQNGSLLYVHDNSVNCTICSNCTVCLHRLLKLLPNSSIESFKQYNVSLPPNKRPETCPRFNTRFQVSICGLYHNYNRLLTIGDGDFSFSLSLINAGNQSNKLIATSYESYNTITTVYPNCKSIIQQLQNLGVKVYHQVDAANLFKSFQIKAEKFDVIVWNFPCIGIEAGADGQAEHIEKNQQLLHDFFQNASSYLSSTGRQEIHLTHKTIEPFSWWDIIQIGQKNNYIFMGSVVFDRCLYPGYINRKALDRKSFPSTDAQTFVFKWDSAREKEEEDELFNNHTTSANTATTTSAAITTGTAATTISTTPPTNATTTATIITTTATTTTTSNHNGSPTTATNKYQLQNDSSPFADNPYLSLFSARVKDIDDYIISKFSMVENNNNNNHNDNDNDNKKKNKKKKLVGIVGANHDDDDDDDDDDEGRRIDKCTQHDQKKKNGGKEVEKEVEEMKPLSSSSSSSFRSTSNQPTNIIATSNNKSNNRHNHNRMKHTMSDVDDNTTTSTSTTNNDCNDDDGHNNNNNRNTATINNNNNNNNINSNSIKSKISQKKYFTYD